MMRPSRVRKNSLCPLRDQMGNCPPPVDIGVLGPGPGKGRTYTSNVPDSFEEYATQRPSGEKDGHAGQGVGPAIGSCRNSFAFPRRGCSALPSTGTTQISARRPGTSLTTASHLPSAENDDGKPLKSPSPNGCPSPEPSLRIR